MFIVEKMRVDLCIFCCLTMKSVALKDSTKRMGD
jgi:hypothetical protein